MQKRRWRTNIFNCLSQSLHKADLCFPLDFHINGLNPGFLWNMLPIINSDSEEWKKETTKSET